MNLILERLSGEQKVLNIWPRRIMSVGSVLIHTNKMTMRFERQVRKATGKEAL